MRDVTIALIQHASPVGKTDDNLETAVGWIRKAAKRHAELICLPELNITGHAGHAEMIAHAEPIPDGPSVTALTELARELNVFIAAGIAEDDRGIHYNTQFIVGPEGFVGKQRKVHLSSDEYFYFRHGSDIPVFDLPMARAGIIICYDNCFPEIARCLAVKGAEVLLCPHAARSGAWSLDPKRRREMIENRKKHWRRVHQCRAYDNGCYVALCDTAGRSTTALPGVQANHLGGCMVVDPDGEILAESKSRDVKDELVVVELKARAVEKRRAQACFNLQTRRPEVFGALTEPTA